MKKEFKVIITSQGETLLEKIYKTENAITALQSATKEINLSKIDSVKIDVREN